ncbi:FAD-binding protein [Zobellia nedashkovskayae]
MQETVQDSGSKDSKNQPNTYDSIIIGSGAGGLATAICLARAGKKSFGARAT